MAADLHCSLTFVRHMAICTAYSATCVHALTPQLKFWVLRLVRFRASLPMLVIVERRAIWKDMIVICLLNLVYFKTLIPGEEQCLLRCAIVFDVALAADKAAHFLPACIRIGVVRLLSIARTPSSYAR